MGKFFERGFALAACLLGVSLAAGPQTRAPNPSEILSRGRQLAFHESPRAALPLLEQALPLFRARRDTRGEALTLGYIGYCYEELSDYPRAIQYLDQALALKRAIGDRDEEGRTLNDLGLVYWDLADYPKANENLDRAVGIAREVHDLKLEGSALSNLGLISDEMGTYDRSLPLYRHALAADRAAHFDRGEANVLGNLGGDDQLLGQFREGLKYYRQARDLDAKDGLKPNLSEDYVDLGLCRLGLGQAEKAIAMFDRAAALAGAIDLEKVAADAHRDKGSALLQLGRYDAARREYRQAIGVYERAGLKEQLVEALNDDGTLLEQLGDASDAEADFRRAIALAGAIDHPRGVTMNLIALADLDRRRGRDEEAVAVYREAFRRASAVKDQGSMAASLLDLSLALRDEKRFAEARQQALQAQAIARSTGAQPLDAQAFYALAEVDRRNGNPAKAFEEYIAGERIARSVDDTELEWRLAYGEGRTLEALHRDSEALAAYRRAIAVIEGVRSLLGAKRFQAGYLQDKYQVYVALVRLLLQMGRKATAFFYSEKLRELSYRDIVFAQSPGGLVPGQELQSRIRQLQRALDSENAAPPSPASRQARAIVSARLETAEREFEAKLDDLSSRKDPLAGMRGLAVASAGQVEAHLPARSALVEYLVGKEGVTAFVLTRNALHAETVPVTSANLRAKVDLFRNLLANAPSADWLGPAKSLESLLIEPLEKPGWLKGVTRMYLVPNAVLYYLPFAALPVSAGGSWRYLIQDYDISYLPAAAALVYGRMPGHPETRLLAVAPAEPGLKYAQQEAQSLAALYGGRSLALEGRTATKKAFLGIAGNFEMIDLATHGFFDRLDPLFSGVQLQPGAHDNGRLKVYEILRMRLRARIVTLSACETALGSGYFNRFPAGDEFVGLTRAFLSAGSSSVLASLWDANDRSTLVFMRAFYGSLRQTDEAAALRRAQLALIRAGGPFSQPFYWAPFVLVEAHE